MELNVPLGKWKETPLIIKKNKAIYPATPTLLNKLTINPTFIDKWNNQRRKTIEIPKHILDNSNLREYQKEVLPKILTLNSIGIFDQQRMGKTPTTLFSLKLKDRLFKLNRVLIISPKSALINWEQECEKWFTNSVIIAKGTKGIRGKRYNTNSKVIISTYKTVMIDADILPEFDCIIVDEAHRLRNFKGQRSKYSPKSVKEIMKISYKAKYKYALTGTPSSNKSEDVFAILHFLYPNLFTSYYNFLEYYYELEERYVSRNKTITEVACFKKGKQKELQEFLDFTSIQRKRKDYMQWIPAVDKLTINLSLDQKETLWYNEIAETYECKELDVSCPNLLSQMIALRKRTVYAKEKEEWIIDYLDDYPDEQIIITSMFTKFLQELKDKLLKQDSTKRIALLVGSTSALQRQKIENDFNKKKINIILANTVAIKESMKFEQCNTMIIVDPSLTYVDNEQLEDRLIPTNQEIALNKDKQQIIRLVIKDTVDEYIDKQLKRKASQVEIINNFKANKTSHTS